MTPELVLDCHAKIGESLLWVPEEDRLYFVDIKAPALHALRPATGETQCWPLPADIGGFALNGQGQALVALRDGLYWLTLSTGRLDLIVPSPFDSRLIRFNESACDSMGRFWVGTMTDPPPGVETTRVGALYSFTTHEGLRAHPDIAYVTNGMAWTADETVFFLSHSEERVIYKYDYDAATGQLGVCRPFVVIAPGQGVPDGAAVDRQGGYWCAMHGAGCLYRYGPDGELTATVTLPVSQPTMCCFAGPDLAHMYISSARDGLDDAQLRDQRLAGALFRVQPPYAGLKRHWRVA